MCPHFIFTGEVRPAKTGELVGSSDGVFRLRSDSDIPHTIYRAVDCVTQSNRELERENTILRAAVEDIAQSGRNMSLLDLIFGLDPAPDAVATRVLERLDNPEYCP